MSVGTADIHKEMAAAWDANNLDTPFESYWTVTERGEFQALNDTEALADQPFPYCVFDASTPPEVITRMSYGENAKRHIRDIPWEFHVHAQPVGDGATSKGIAAHLAGLIMEVYGGHPTIPPRARFNAEHGSILIVQYQTDYGVRTGDKNEWQWVVSYIIRVDVPVAV